MAKTILIVDDNALIRKALCEMFKGEEDLDVCGEAENGRDAIEKAQQLRPDLVVLDRSFQSLNLRPLWSAKPVACSLRRPHSGSVS